MDAEQLLQAGIKAIQSGELQRARILLARAIQHDRNSDQAWLWLARSMSDEEKQRECLTEALRINPENLSARKELEKLRLAAPGDPNSISSGQMLMPTPEPDRSNPKLDSPMRPFTYAKSPSRSIILGIAAGIISVGAIAGFLMMGGLFGASGDDFLRWLGFSRTPLPSDIAATLPPVWTKTRTPLPSPTRTPATPSLTPTPTPTLPYQDRLATSQPQIARLIDRMDDLDCAAVINAWSNIIEFLPEYGPAYYWRAKEMKCDTAARGDINTYVAKMYSILDDINTAIELDTNSTGDYFALRFDVFNALASTYDLRSDRDYLSSFALDDILRAVQLGSTNPLSSRHPAFQLTYLGRCQEAITEANRLKRLILWGESPSAGIETALADAYLCERQYTAALASIEKAISISSSPERRYTRALALYALGRLREARAELDELIAAEPNYGGYRYHLRALILLDTGDIESAQSDLIMGLMNSWGAACMPALVQGLLALDIGDTYSAVEYFRYAEATCTPRHRPVWDRALRELGKLDAATMTTDSSLTVTPAPATRPIDSGTGTENLPHPPAIERSYLRGTGIMEFRGPGFLTMHLSTAQTVDVTRVYSMEIEIEPGTIPTGNDVTIYLLNPLNGFWSMYPWSGETIRVIQPDRFLYPDASLYISTMIDGTDVTTLENVRIRCDVLSDNFGRITLGEDA